MNRVLSLYFTGEKLYLLLLLFSFYITNERPLIKGHLVCSLSDYLFSLLESYS